jgi:hypothetical protein
VLIRMHSGRKKRGTNSIVGERARSRMANPRRRRRTGLSMGRKTLLRCRVPQEVLLTLNSPLSLMLHQNLRLSPHKITAFSIACPTLYRIYIDPAKQSCSKQRQASGPA